MKNTVSGFLRAKGTTLVNDDGNFILKGWGIGGWLLPEGYMWKNDGAKNFDRPRNISERVKELLGQSKSAEFWNQYRNYFFTEDDVAFLKSCGYNCIRLPFESSLFLEDEPGIHFLEAGFNYIDQVVQWCHKYDLYVILDMHGAPGGQTGANIDNSIDTVPRLFIDTDKFKKGLALWEEIAKKYHNDPYVGGYDLLNEPIRPGNDDLYDYDYLITRLSEFYDTSVQLIRKYDKNHMFSIEGYHWAMDSKVFTHRFDDNMVIHFHLYGGIPEQSVIQHWIDLRESLNTPLWLGETGENNPEWMASVTQMCLANNIGYCFWTYKKMGGINSLLQVKTPQNWDLIIAYIKGAAHPGYKMAQSIFNEFLDNLKFKKCEENISINNAVVRKESFSIRATDCIDYDSIGSDSNRNFSGYRNALPINIHPLLELPKKSDDNSDEDHFWMHFSLNLVEGDSVSYLVPYHKNNWQLNIIISQSKKTTLKIRLDDNTKIMVIPESGSFKVDMPMNPDNSKLSISCQKGKAALTKIIF